MLPVIQVIRGASQIEKSPRLNWVTQFLTVAYDGACSPNVSVRMAWISFSALPCRKEKKTRWQLASRCFWNCARRLTCFLSNSVTRKDLQFALEQTPLSNDTMDSVLRYREGGRARDLTVSHVITQWEASQHVGNWDVMGYLVVFLQNIVVNARHNYKHL